MIKFISTSLIFLAVAQCSDSKNENLDSINEENSKVVGNTIDDKGCNTTTGSSWSDLKQNCIQPFKEGQRLNPTNLKVNDVVISAFILLNEDKSQMELFLPKNNSKTIILDLVDDNTYENGIYVYKISDASLYIDSVKRYALVD